MDELSAELRRLWQQWSEVVADLAHGKSLKRISPRRYEDLHRDLLYTCRKTQQSTDRSLANLGSDMKELATPWGELDQLAKSNRGLLLDLTKRCDQATAQIPARTQAQRKQGKRRARQLVMIIIGGAVVAGAYFMWQRYSGTGFGIRRTWWSIQRFASGKHRTDFFVIAIVFAAIAAWFLNSTKKS